MIDIHTHILPGVDDGSDCWETSLAMARMAVKSGVSSIVATPHCGLSAWDINGKAEIVEDLIAAFREKLSCAGIDLTVYGGMEIFGTSDSAALLHCGNLGTLNGSRYPLIEFPFERFGRQATHILGETLSMGYRPVVAHPERYQYIQMDPAILNVWVDMGCLLQLNRGSLFGRFGSAAQELAWDMVERGFACFVASDAHSSVRRTTWMKDAYELLCAEFSENTAYLLLEEYPAKLLRDEDINLTEPKWF